MTLDGKVTGLVFGIVVRHHQFVVDPKLNVLTHRPDAVTEPFAVLGQQLGGLARRLAGFP